MKDFLELKLANRLNLSMELIKFDKTIVSRLKDAKIESLNVSMRDLWTLDIKVPYYIQDKLTHNKVKNGDYELVREEKLIRLKCGDSYAMFVIKEINIDTKNNYKIAKCYSTEKCITKRVVLQKSTIQLKKDDIETGKGIFDLMEEELRGWKLGYLDELAKKEPAEIGFVNKYRYFDGIEKTWHSFLREDLPNSYDCFCLFDTYKKLINVYDRKSYGKKTGWIINKKNIVNNIVKNSNTKDIVTKLYVYGKENLSISDVNPLGDYVLDYDYIKKEMSDDMSDELKSALDKYELKTKILFDNWMVIFKSIQDLNYKKIQEESKKTALDEVLMVKKAEQAVLLTSQGKTPQQITQIKADIARLYKEMDDVGKQIVQIFINIKALDTQIESKQKQMDTITASMQIENISDNNIKIFNENMLEELDWYTYIDKQENEVFFTPHALYGWAKDRIKEISRPGIEFKIDSNDFTSRVKGYEGYKQKIVIGDTIVVKDDKTGSDEVRFISYTYKPDVMVDKIDLVFSTTDRQEEKKNPVSSSMRNSANTKNYLNSKKWDWMEASTNTDYIKSLREHGLNAAVNHIFSENNKNKIQIDGNGQWFYNADDENQVMVLSAGYLVISDDGLKTAKLAITPEGVNAEMIIGKILLGEKLEIGSENGLLNIENGLITIYDKNYKPRLYLGLYDKERMVSGLKMLDPSGNSVVLDENGMVNNYQFVHHDEIDSTHPITLPYYVDEGVKSLRKVMLTIMPQPFRTNSKGAGAGGGNYGSTSEGGGYNDTTYSGGGSSSTSGGGGYYDASGVSQRWGNPYYVDSFSSVFYLVEKSQAGDGVNVKFDHFKHTHPITVPTHYHSVSTPSHAHGIYIAPHSHTVSVDSHVHDLIYGIYESSKPSNLKVFINDVLIVSGINIDTTIDISTYLKLNAMNKIRVQSDSLGRVMLNIFTKAYVAF